MPCQRAKAAAGMESEMKPLAAASVMPLRMPFREVSCVHAEQRPVPPELPAAVDWGDGWSGRDDEALRGPVGCLPRHQREVGDLAKRQRWRAVRDHP